MKALILNNQARAMSIFWRVLMEKMRDYGMETICCVPGGDIEAEKVIRDAGARIINYPLDRKGLNPFKDLHTYLQLKKIMADEKPDLIFTSTIKPVIYGCLAAKTQKIPAIFATITGLGYVFEQDSLQKKAIHWLGKNLYRAALKNISGIFFQNCDDASLFKADKIISDSNRICFAPGTGVDTNRFQKAPFPDGDLVFLLTGRLLQAKGIEEFAQAARILKSRWPNARFQILGIPEKGPGSLPLEMIMDWQKDGLVEYLGQTRDVRPCIAASHVAVLPSWREGTPTSLLEAMSMGRPLVATDVPGCREVVDNDKNGFLCNVKDPESLARAMEKFLLDPALVKSMGAESRKRAVQIFDGQKVAENIIKDMLSVMKKDKMESFV